MNRSLFGSLMVCASFSLPTQAGGLWLNEFGDPAGGRASAGAAAGVDDASTVLHNPASISRLEDHHLLLAVGYLQPDTQFDVESSAPAVGMGDGGSAGVGTPAASAFYVRDLDSEKWSAGISMAALSGAGLDYDNDWVGRYQVQETSLLLLGIAPTLAYQVTDQLSIGASVQFWYTKLEMDVAIANPLPPAGRPDGQASVDGDDYDVGMTAGLMYEFSPQTRIGLSYQSEIESSYDSDLEISPIGLQVQANLDIPLAQKVRVGLHHDLNASWGLDLSAGWEEWSTFDHVLIQTPRVAAAIDQGWKDTWHVAVGFQYYYSPEMTFTAGVAYDTSAQTDGRRTADLPVDEQLRIAAGFTREVRDDLVVGAYLNWADLGDARIESPDFVGEYSANTLLQFSLNFSWKFDK